MSSGPWPQPGALTRADVEAAAVRIRSGIRPTPVFSLHGAEIGVPGQVVLKLELMQHTGSFKARGALNSIATLGHRPAGVVAASGGNHGAAVAWAAARSALPADVFVPASSPKAKRDRIASYGATLHVVDGYYPAAVLAARHWAAGRDVEDIHAYDGFGTVCGQGTVGLEIGDEVPNVETVLVGCGGGGLFAGVATALDGRCTVVPVEPKRCPTLHAALAAGAPIDVEVGGVAADSLGAAKIGMYAYAAAVASGAVPALVSEDAILAARSFLWEGCRVLAEPGACVGLAALMTQAVSVRPGSTTVVVISGGNNPTIP